MGTLIAFPTVEPEPIPTCGATAQYAQSSQPGVWVFTCTREPGHAGPCQAQETVCGVRVTAEWGTASAAVVPQRQVVRRRA